VHGSGLQTSRQTGEHLLSDRVDCGELSASLTPGWDYTPGFKGMNFRTSRAGLACAIYFLLHLAAQFSAVLFEVAPGISLWYPPCGLALSLLVLLGPRYWFVVFLANFSAAWATLGTSAWWVTILYPGLITANYTGVAWIVRRVLGTRRLLPGTTQETFVFAVTMAGAPIPLAFAGSAISTTIELTPHSDFFRSFMQWWVGDASGLLTVVPVAMVFAAPWLQKGTPLPRNAFFGSCVAGNLFLQGAVLLACLWAVFIF
jgi:integral membrane sensor domain MASE1